MYIPLLYCENFPCLPCR